MTDFRPDCIINFHVEKRGSPAKAAWSCSITHPKHGRLVLASRFLGPAEKDEAELAVILFGLKQAARFLQEKVEVCATFPLEGRLPKANNPSGGRAGGLESKDERGTDGSPKANVKKAWSGFRLRRVAKMAPAEAELLRKESENA